MKLFIKTIAFLFVFIIGLSTTYAGKHQIAFHAAFSSPAPTAALVQFFGGMGLLLALVLIYWLPRFSATSILFIFILYIVVIMYQMLVYNEKMFVFKGIASVSLQLVVIYIFYFYYLRKTKI